MSTFKSIMLVLTAIMFYLRATYCEDDFYFEISPESRSVKSGEHLQLQCRVSNDQHIMYTWTLNGGNIYNTSRRFQHSNNLTILRTDPFLDSGTISCIATNTTSGFSITSLPAKLNIQWIGNATQVVPFGSESAGQGHLEVVAGDHVTLRCKVEGSPEIEVAWFINGKVTKGRSKKLVLGQVGPANSGTYSCRARNQAGASKMQIPLVVSVTTPDSGVRLIRFKAGVVQVRGASADFICSFSTPAMTRWFFNDTLLSNSSRWSVGDDGRLVVSRVDDDVQGWFVCDAGDASGLSFGSQLQIAYLHPLNSTAIIPQPEFEDGMYYMSEYSAMQITCVAPEGLPAPHVWWQGPDGRNMTYPYQSEVSVLTLTRIRFEDSGIFTCRTSHPLGSQSVSINVSVTSIAVIQNHPISQTVIEDQPVLLSCSFIGTPAPASKILWLKDGKAFSNPAAEQGLWNSSLRFIADPRNAGDYACVVHTIGQHAVTSQTATVHVASKLKFTLAPVSKKLELGSTSKLHCRAQGQPKPVVRWIKDVSLSAWPEHIKDTNGTLYFHGVRAQDAGSYTCVATNAQGYINATISIDVIVLPHFTVLPENITISRVGDRLQLHCQADGLPVPTIQWDKDSVLNGFASDRFNVDSNGTLFIDNVLVEDEGFYGCTAGNAGGFKRAEIRLVVQGRDYGSERDGESIVKTVVITLGAAAAYILLSVSLLFWCRMRRRQRKMNSDAAICGHADPTTNGNGTQVALLSKEANVESSSGTVAARMNSGKLPELNESDVEKGQLIARGSFGDVFEGNVVKGGTRRVLLRCLTTKNEELMVELRRQCDMFQRAISDNLASIVGVYQHAELQYLVVECEGTFLKTYLLSRKQELPLASVRGMTLQIARGMLALAEARFIHRDLATRNIIIQFAPSDQIVLKITSLGMNKHPFSGDYFQWRNDLIPLRWLPHEAVFDDDYSTKSDAWMFACTVWELVSSGKQPLADLSDEDVVNELRQKRIDWTVQDCHPFVKLFSKCWSYDPLTRPSFQQILESVEAFPC